VNNHPKDGKKEVIIAEQPYESQLLLQRIYHQNKLKDWLLSQSQYEGFTVIVENLEEIDVALNDLNITLWEYVFSWNKAARIPTSMYDDLHLDNCNYSNYMSFDNLFAVNQKEKRIILPRLEVIVDDEEMVTAPFDEPQTGRQLWSDTKNIKGVLLWN
jgi:hypothetical protein